MVYAVIMAGGAGTRFWPESTQQKPKQFLNMFGERSLLQNTVERTKSLIPKERQIVVTNERYTGLVQEQLPDVPAENIIGEPQGKNTAPCIAMAAAFLQKKDPEAVMVVLPADHHIAYPEKFINYLETAIAQARAGENLVTMGIQPTRPETGYGYIQYESEAITKREGNPVHTVKTFTEKPDLKTAEKFLDSGDFLWNSGMFIWKASTILSQMQKHLPEIHSEAVDLKEKLFTEDQKEGIETFYENCSNISIDYGIMEKASTVYVIPGEFGWNDVGSWKAIYELGEKDDDGNVLRTELFKSHEASNNLVSTSSDKLIALVGVKNVAVVETDSAILVCDLDKAQGVKQIVNQLKKDQEAAKYL